MKHIILIICLFLSINVNGQYVESIDTVLSRILNHAETSSLYRNKVGWDTIRTKVLELAKQAKTVPELSKALKYLLESIGDEHARVYYKNQMIAYNYGSLKEHHKAFNLDIYNQIQGGNTYHFEAKNIENKVGYIRIVGLPMGDNLMMAKSIEDEICKVGQTDVDKWVVDLRYNGGGNMHPMAEGLAQIIGDGAVGGTAGLTKAENSNWTISNDNYYYDDFSIQLENACKLVINAKVAVLTSVYTGSSGEALAVIFKGREKTRFFGEKTFGMITATDYQIIDDATVMSISVSYYKDRNGKVYDKYVDVDEEIPFVLVPLSPEDIAVTRAVEWLKTKE